MGDVRTRECDVCQKRYELARSLPPVYFGEYKSFDGQLFEVCPACEARLMAPLRARMGR